MLHVHHDGPIAQRHALPQHAVVALVVHWLAGWWVALMAAGSRFWRRAAATARNPPPD